MAQLITDVTHVARSGSGDTQEVVLTLVLSVALDQSSLATLREKE